MRRLCVFIFLSGAVLLCISCQKEYSNEQLAPTQTLIQTVHALHYDTAGAFYTGETQIFTYDKTLRRTVAAITDSGANIPGGVRRWTETFQYDAENRLAQFSSTATHLPAGQIDFSYNGTDIDKAVIKNQWLGKDVICTFALQAQNGGKILTMYDTSGNYVTNTDTRPQVNRYVFDAGGQLLRETVFYTIFKRPQNWFEDTTDVQMFYDGNAWLNRQVINYAFRFSQVSTVTDYARDSLQFTREGTNTVISQTFRHIYKNMFWFSISENPDGFANALNLGKSSYFGPPLSTAGYWQTYPPSPVILDYAAGTYQNTFNAKGLLEKTIYPVRFANEYGGRTEISYTYTKY